MTSATRRAVRLSSTGSASRAPQSGTRRSLRSRLTVALDEGLLAHVRVSFHPLRNTATTTIEAADLIRFLRATGHEPVIVPRTAAASIG